jgi:hypothetical protein
MTLEDKILEFIAYRKAIKKPIREVSMEAFKKKLIKLGNSNEETMIEILEQSIANGWQGIFELKQTKNNGKQTNQNINNSDLDSLNDAADRVLQQFANGINQGNINKQQSGNMLN